MQILIYCVIFYVGAMFGFVVRWGLQRLTSYSGTIVITKDEGKTLYSLEIAEDLDVLEFKKEVVFKVDTSKLEENRD